MNPGDDGGEHQKGGKSMRFNATRLDQGLIASNLSAVPEPATFVCPDNREI